MVTGSNEWGSGCSEQVRRSNERVERAACRGQQVQRTGCDGVTSGWWRAVGRAALQRSRGSGTDKPDLTYREKSGWKRIIIKRFKDQRNPGAAGKRAAESGAVKPNFQPQAYRTELQVGEAVRRLMKGSKAILHDNRGLRADFMRDVVPGMRPNATANTQVSRGFRAKYVTRGQRGLGITPWRRDKACRNTRDKGKPAWWGRRAIDGIDGRRVNVTRAYKGAHPF
ncbi:hypothetical protein B0H14DRAFT_2630000 [Mycena olivaceomarginata]|nr:hypothetical protein B0H14DRAFT_2630000 [Mycena olivaceomarginata]